MPFNALQSEIAGRIDHTLLRADATHDEILRVCDEAAEYGFASVCVNPYWVAVVARRLRGSRSKVCTVIGFPLGATATACKVSEAAQVFSEGAEEIDMVQNIGALKGGDRAAVLNEIHLLASLAEQNKGILKVILETALLTDGQKAEACRIAKEAGAQFVKTSTGFGPSGATVQDVELMRRTVGPTMGVKASGGIRTLEDVRKMLAAGATRIGASASVKIIQSSGEPDSSAY